MTPEETHEDAEPQLDARNAAERRTLLWVLGINFLQVLIAGVMGVAADSTGLLGTAIDNLADAAVYAISLYAVGRSMAHKAWAARISGTCLMVLNVALLVEVVRRFVQGSEPVGLLMIATAVVNAGANLIVLKLLRSHRKGGVHLRASWIFTTNDMLANLGIVVSGVAVIFLKSSFPDLLIGLVVVGIGFHGGKEILEQAREARSGTGS